MKDSLAMDKFTFFDRAFFDFVLQRMSCIWYLQKEAHTTCHVLNMIASRKSKYMPRWPWNMNCTQRAVFVQNFSCLDGSWTQVNLVCNTSQIWESRLVTQCCVTLSVTLKYVQSKCLKIFRIIESLPIFRFFFYFLLVVHIDTINQLKLKSL